MEKHMCLRIIFSVVMISIILLQPVDIVAENKTTDNLKNNSFNELSNTIADNADSINKSGNLKASYSQNHTSIIPPFAFIEKSITGKAQLKIGTNSSSILVPIGRQHVASTQLQKEPLTRMSMAIPGQQPSTTIQERDLHPVSGFDGLTQSTSNFYDPPDVQMAVGPTHILEMVNSELEIFSKGGMSLQTKSLASFFGLNAGDNVSDVKVLYDSLSGRWFSTVEDFTTGLVYIAISSSNDPTGTWTVYQLTFSDFPDQPILGLNDDKVVVSVNDFSDSSFTTYVGAQYIILDKNDLLTSSPVSSQISSVLTGIFSIHPVQSLGSTSTLYMVSTFGSFTSELDLYSISGSVPSATTTKTSFIINLVQSPPSAVQPGTSAQIDTGDVRTLDAVWYQGKLWLAFSDSCTPSGDSQARSCIHLIQVNTASSSIIQNFDFGTAGFYYFYPAIRVDSSGNLDAIFGYSSSSTNPSLAITGQATTDSINTIQQPVVLKLGSGSQTQTDSNGRVRYGDYFAASVDPSTTGTVWVAGEYTSSNVNTIGWSTFIGSVSRSQSQTSSELLAITDSLQISKTDGCITPNLGDWVISSSCTLVSSATAPANVIIQSGAVLTIPNGSIFHVDFAHHHILVKSGGKILIKSGGSIK